MKFHCCDRCGQRVFFENVACVNCGASLGFEPDLMRLSAFEVDEAGAWHRLAADVDAPPARPCQNYAEHAVCNWMVAEGDANPLCRSCRTTRILPNLGKPENLGYWAQLEAAKRRMLHGLLALGLPMPSKLEDEVHGVAFEFLESTDPARRVLTGHDDGVITLNVEEADDAKREAARVNMHEPSRTLLGHFRHEIGHYYWDRLVAGTPALESYRALFGDEQADYPEALRKHYASPRTDWMTDCISLYASSHPWEDWAECWAHYLHMQDGLETAEAWGLRLDHAVPDVPPVQARALSLKSRDLERSLVESWLPIAQFSNAMARSLGVRDAYPFVVPPAVVDKLTFIHRLIRDAVAGRSPMNFSPAEGPTAPAA